jgi:hypothetical protein
MLMVISILAITQIKEGMNEKAVEKPISNPVIKHNVWQTLILGRYENKNSA